MSTLAARAYTQSNASLKQACTRAFKSSATLSAQKDEVAVKQDQKNESEEPKKRKKTVKELDEEIRAAMEGRSGDGGISGAELEGGKAVSMKRGLSGRRSAARALTFAGVRDNMFRYI